VKILGSCLHILQNQRRLKIFSLIAFFFFGLAGGHKISQPLTFSSSCDFPNFYHSLCRISGHTIWGILGCFTKLNRSFGEDFGSNLCNLLSCLPYKMGDVRAESA